MKNRQMDAEYLRSKINIDRDALHEGIEEQPGLFFAAADLLTTALSLRDQAKTEMENEYSRACGRARNQDEDGKKPTEGAIKEAAQLDKKYLAAVAEYQQAKEAADSAAVLRDSFEMRAKMLREMSQLYIAGYYQASSVGPSTKHGIDDKAAQVAREGMHRARLGMSKRGV